MLKIPSLRFLTRAHGAGKLVPNYFSLFDVGTDTVKIAVVDVKPGAINVLGHSLAPVNGRDVAGGRAQAAALAGAINRALQEAEDATEALAGRKIVPDHALFSLPGRALKGQRFSVKQRRSRPGQPITPKELDALWERAVRLAKQGLPSLSGVGDDWVPQTVTPAGLWLDNHLVNDAAGLQGAALSLSVYGVTSHPAILRGLEQLSEKLELEIFRLVPASQALATIVPARDALLLDVGAGGTDCCLMRHDALAAAGRVPAGGTFFTRAMSRAFKCDLESAEALKVAFATGALTAADVTLVRRSLQLPLARWATEIAEAVTAMPPATETRTLPAQLYLTGGSAVLPGLNAALLNGLKEAGFTFERSPEISSLGQTALNGFNHGPSGFRGMLFALALSLAKTV
ncbi:MAG: hypothetical protein ACE5G8_14335 [Anaerolineae bacterium]